MTRKFLWLLQLLTWWQKKFRNTSTVMPSKSDYSTSNTSMENFILGLNSAIYIIELGVILERRYVLVFYLLQAYDYDRKYRSCQRVFKSKLTEKYDNILLFVTVEQNRPIIIIGLTSLGSQLVSNFVDKKIILIQVAVILEEDA